MFVISLSSCIRAKYKLDQSVFAIHDSPLYFEISEDDHPRTVNNSHASTFICIVGKLSEEIVPKTDFFNS